MLQHTELNSYSGDMLIIVTQTELNSYNGDMLIIVTQTELNSYNGDMLNKQSKFITHYVSNLYMFLWIL